MRDLFNRSARVFGERTAVVDGSDCWSYHEVDQRANRLANALLSSGFSPGDRIAVLSEPRHEYVELYAAAAKCGVTVVALNTRMHPEELAWCIRQARPRSLVASDAHLPILDLLTSATDLDSIIALDDASADCRNYAALVDEGDPSLPDVDVHPDDIHNILFTSGTTGRPKGAMISHRAAATRALRLAQWFRLTPDDGFVGWVPLFHCGGDESLYATYLTGGRFAALRRPDIVEMYEVIQRERLTWTLLLPGVITDFLHHSDRTAYNLSSLRFAVGYANMQPSVVAELTKTLDISFMDAFGQTETSYLVAFDAVLPGSEPSLRKMPTPYMDVRLVDDGLNEVPVGVAGECVVRGPSVMSGYLDDSEATADAFRGGWLHTGDVLVRHADGTLEFTDRKKYLIKTGGESVFPAEIEGVLAKHPGVQEVCVVSVPDDRWGEAIKAVVVPRPGHDVTLDDLAMWCAPRLAPFKRPKYIEFMPTEDMPRSTTGKLLRHELQRRDVTEEQRVGRMAEDRGRITASQRRDQSGPR